MLEEKYKPKTWLLNQNEDKTYKLEINGLASNCGEDIEIKLIVHKIMIDFDNSNNSIIPVPSNYEVLKNEDDNTLFHLIMSE